MRIRIEGLSKRFSSQRGIVTAIDKLNLEVGDNEFFILLGPSGCGKSTLLNLIAGLERPTEGEIFFDERLVASAAKDVCLSPKKRNVAFVFQSYALYPHLNVFENIAFPLKAVNAGSAFIKEAVHETAGRLHIEELLSARPSELSGGERQRTAIARAIVREPDIFLLDEPLSNLDARLRTSMRSELKSLQKGLGVTTIYVTHDQLEAISLGDRIAVIKDGKIEQAGSPKELYEHPVNIFIGQFIGYPPMNILKAYCTTEVGIYYISLQGNKLRASRKMVLALGRMGEGAFKLGIRPEDIHINSRGSSLPLKAKVFFVEPMGTEAVVGLTLGEEKLTAVSGEKDVAVGDLVDIELFLENAHIFADR